jgi:hypothetical protein
MTTTYNRISARKGAPVRLNMTFFANGVASDPYALRSVKIYRNTVAEENLVHQLDITDDPGTSDYPSPIVRASEGHFYYDWEVPDDVAPDSYIDEWHFVGDNLAVTDINDETLWDSTCGRFFIIDSSTWYGDDGLLAARLGFEALDKNYVKGEIRPLEVGIMPLPLYSFDWNRIVPLIPYLSATITIETLNCEPLVTNGAMDLGLRQGDYRTNPFVARYLLDTTTFLIGTYRYWIKFHLPNGEVRMSQKLHFSIN